MPVTTLIGKGFPNPANVIKPPKALFGRSRLNNVKAEFPLDATVSATSTLVVGRVPTSAILSPLSTIKCTAITTAAINLGLDRNGAFTAVGLYAPSAGAVAAALASAQALGVAGSFNALSAVSVPNFDAEVWRLLGLTSDPGDYATVYATVSTAATVAGTVSFDLLFSTED